MVLLFTSPEIATLPFFFFTSINPITTTTTTTTTRSSKTTINNSQILLKNETFRSRCSSVRVRVSSSSRIDDAAADVTKLLDPINNNLCYGAFSIKVKSTTTETETETETTKKSREEAEEKENYYVNMGYAIRTLREEFPELFYKELTFDIYRDDIVFKDPLNTFMGIESYKSIFWALRFHGRIFFKALWIDIISVWQPMENVVMVRWTVHGVPRMPWESRGRFDATSEYKLDKNGKIYEHRVHNIAMNSPSNKFHIQSVEELLQAIGCSSTPKPTYFESSSSKKN